MHWVSSKESVAKGEVSVLAIVETLCAIALVFYLSSHFNTLRWLAIAMCVSPLLLLRTTQSTRMGIRWVGRIIKDLGSNPTYHSSTSIGAPLPKIGVALAYLPVGFLLPFLIRFGATLVSICRYPTSTVRAIPKNWVRITLAMDSCVYPEIIPGYPVDLGFLITAILDHPERRERIKRAWLNFPIVIPLFLPALLYRWSLKATSIIYAPLVFVARSTFSEGKDLRTKLELIKRGDLSRIRVLYGIAAIAAFLVKLVLMAKWNGFAAWWNGNPITEFLALYVAPSEIPKWQLAELANSALAIGSMFFARHALLRYDVGQPFPDTPVKRILGFVSGLRWVLALYAIVCTGYITMRAARDWNLPAFGQKWWPW